MSRQSLVKARSFFVATNYFFFFCHDKVWPWLGFLCRDRIFSRRDKVSLDRRY